VHRLAPLARAFLFTKEAQSPSSILRDLAWRMMTAYDLPAVEKIAAVVHPSFYEAREVLAERQQLYPHGCYLLEIGERPAGYVLSHPWRAGSLPPLNTKLGALPAEPDTYYIHDLALLPVARRVGAASRIVDALTKHAGAGGHDTMSLVAVNGSLGFWERHGFAVEDAPQLSEKLLSYELSARLMTKRLV
jgi:ribosomal protein S18 acetylase RimI-like enzyme